MPPFVVAYERYLQIGILALMKMSNDADVEAKTPKGFHVRMPAQLRQRIDEACKISGRSVNSELVARIEAGLNAAEPDLIATIKSLKASVDALNKRLDEK